MGRAWYDKKSHVRRTHSAALIASIDTTVPPVLVGVGLYHLWPYAQYDFGVVG